jgi:FkbH-like protein
VSAATNPATSRRVLLVGDTTLGPLGRMLERSQEAPTINASVAPYGQVYQILLDEQHSVWSLSQPDILVVWTTPQLTLPSVGKMLRFDFESVTTEYESALAEAEQFADAVLRAATHVGLVILPGWILPTYERWIQTLTWRHGTGLTNLVARANLLLAEKFAARPNIILLDAGYWQASLGRPAYDPRMYAFGKILYSNSFFEKAAAEIKSVVRGSFGQTRKIIVCDLDNTLWGGVVGDDGPESLKLGPPDPVGECYHTFQKVLKGMRSRGILLAISSKNDEKLALSVIDEHPAMVLRRSDFVGWRINWNDKAENIRQLAAELNLGLDSFVFLDDSPQERDRVRHALPQVFIPELPASPAEYAPVLSSLTCFETMALEKEDFGRTEMYQADRGRKESLALNGDLDSWLGSLGIEVQATVLCRENLPRAVQLLNKTNQFNLSLRRLDEKSFWEWAQAPCHSAYTFRMSDRFGDLGLVGLTSLSLKKNEARIVDFVMSCRVMGKKVEEALLAYTLNRAQAIGADQIGAEVVNGPRNAPARDFFLGKVQSDNPASIDLAHSTVPPHIALKEGD